MRIVAIADLQGLGPKIKPNLLPQGDMLLIGGDLTSWGTVEELEACNTWLGTLSYQYKIIVGGNHDQALEEIDGKHLFTNATYLQDERIEIDGITIYGSPVSEMNELRLNYTWAFCQPHYLKQVARNIPKGLDILLVHGPCFGVLDQLWWNKKSVGSRDLLDAVLEKKPKYFISGHIHEAHGMVKQGDTTFINAAICSSENKLHKRDGTLFYDPIVITL